MTVTIQRTSKRLKSWLVMANLIQLGGILMLASNTPQTGMWMILGGVIFHVLTRVLIWWNHD